MKPDGRGGYWKVPGQPSAQQKPNESVKLSALEKLDVLAGLLMDEDPRLTPAQAKARVLQRKPEIYAQYLREHPQQLGDA